MSQPARATRDQIQMFLDRHDGWSLVDDKLHREYKFRDFVQAFGFVTQLALLAERAAHHPAWCNVYNQITIDLTTHDAGGISERDFALARAMEALFVKNQQ